MLNKYFFIKVVEFTESNPHSLRSHLSHFTQETHAMTTIHPEVLKEAMRALNFEGTPIDELDKDQDKLIENYIDKNYGKDGYIEIDDRT